MNKFQCVDFISVNLKNILSEMPGVGIGEVMYFFSKYLFEHFNIGTNPESCRSAVSKCVNGKQQSIKGIKFYKRSLKG